MLVAGAHPLTPEMNDRRATLLSQLANGPQASKLCSVQSKASPCEAPRYRSGEFRMQCQCFDLLASQKAGRPPGMANAGARAW